MRKGRMMDGQPECVQPLAAAIISAEAQTWWTLLSVTLTTCEWINIWVKHSLLVERCRLFSSQAHCTNLSLELDTQRWTNCPILTAAGGGFFNTLAASPFTLFSSCLISCPCCRITYYALHLEACSPFQCLLVMLPMGGSKLIFSAVDLRPISPDQRKDLKLFFLRVKIRQKEKKICAWQHDKDRLVLTVVPLLLVNMRAKATCNSSVFKATSPSRCFGVRFPQV